MTRYLPDDNGSAFIRPARSSFATPRRRERLPWSENRPFRILSIDGGGIKGIFPAAVLASLEKRFLGAQSIARYFDLIVGTSTGGILALGLASGRTAQELLDMYMERGREIFPPGRIGRAWRRLRGYALYQYDRKALTKALHSTLEERTIAEAQCRLCIPAFEGHHGEVYIFKTPHHPDYCLDGKERMVTAAEATSAAPCFFQALDSNGYRFVDGGVWANNPIMIGLVDALVCFAVDPVQVRILSLGCGREPVRVTRGMAAGGLWAWRKVIFAAMDLQSQNALGQARLMIGPERVLRLEPKLEEPIELDDWRRSSAELPREAERAVERSAEAIANGFLESEAVPAKFYWPPNPTARVGYR